MTQSAGADDGLVAGRIAGLDAWRSALMLGGLFVHCNAWLSHHALFFVAELISQAFRMGVFFAISGFLAALVLRRTSSERWFARKLWQLGVPAMTGVLAISPAIWWLVRSRAGGAGGDMPLMFEWAHIWFLWGLLLASAVLRQLDRRPGRGQGIVATLAGLPPMTLLLGTAVTSALLFAATPPMLLALLSPRLVRAYANVQLIAGYLPMYLLGVLVARRADVRQRLLDRWRSSLAVLAVVAVPYGAVMTGLVPAIEPQVRFVGAALCPPLVFVLVLRSALSIRSVPRVVTALSEASYTIYLLHVPIAVAINTRLPLPALDPRWHYVLTILLAGGLSWLVHVAVVRRSRLAALLLNGRVPVAV